MKTLIYEFQKFKNQDFNIKNSGTSKNEFHTAATQVSFETS